MQFDYNYRIRERDLDTFGHVNNAIYLAIYEEARWEFLRDQGITWTDIQKTNIGPVILDVNLQFKRELKNQDQIVVRSIFHPFNGGKISKIEQHMLKDSDVHSTAIFTFAVFDMKARKIILPPDHWVKLGQ